MTIEVAHSTVSFEGPELVACVVSPEYVAVILIIVPTVAVGDGLYVILQELGLELPDNVHVLVVVLPTVKVPPFPPSLHDMVPVGAVGVELVSVTVPVNIIVFARSTIDGFGNTVVLVP